MIGTLVLIPVKTIYLEQGRTLYSLFPSYFGEGYKVFTYVKDKHLKYQKHFDKLFLLCVENLPEKNNIQSVKHFDIESGELIYLQKIIQMKQPTIESNSVEIQFSLGENSQKAYNIQYKGVRRNFPSEKLRLEILDKSAFLFETQVEKAETELDKQKIVSDFISFLTPNILKLIENAIHSRTKISWSINL